MCLFVDYTIEKKGSYFYNPKEGKVLISINATFLEESYIQDLKSRSKVILEEMFNNIVTSTVPNMKNVPINEEILIEH